MSCQGLRDCDYMASVCLSRSAYLNALIMDAKNPKKFHKNKLYNKWNGLNVGFSFLLCPKEWPENWAGFFSCYAQFWCYWQIWFLCFVFMRIGWLLWRFSISLNFTRNQIYCERSAIAKKKMKSSESRLHKATKWHWKRGTRRVSYPATPTSISTPLP